MIFETVLYISMLLLAYAFTPRPAQKQDAKSREMERPTAAEGGSIPVLFGTRLIQNGNIGWFGDVVNKAIRRDNVTVGYKYFAGFMLVLCRGPVDKFVRLKVSDVIVWAGNRTTNGIEQIDKADIFGEQGSDGGIVGPVRFRFGLPDQTVDTYMATKLAEPRPAFRGVAAIIAQKMYLGMSPSMKPWSVRVQRIMTRQDGVSQWYDSKAAIPNPFFVGYDLGNLQGELTITTAHPDPTPDPDPIVLTFRTGSGTRHTVRFRLDGVFEMKTHTGGTSLSDHVVSGGSAPFLDPYINYRLQISSPPQELFLNCDPLAASQLFPETISNEYFNVEIDDGATLLLTAHLPTGVMLGAYQRLSVTAVEVDNEIETNDMNPAHILRECLTDPDWGLGYQDSDIDDDSFERAADTLFDEGMGISILYDSQDNIEEFINVILRHIDGVLYVSRSTGTFVLKLIRDDYDEDQLLELDESNIVEIQEFVRPAFGELTNSVSVTYWHSGMEQNSTLTIQDHALASEQGAVVATTVEYEGFTNPKIASRAAQRDLQALSSPLISATIIASSAARTLNIGGVFKLSWADYGISSVIMRVTALAFGDGRTNQIRIVAVEDKFYTPTTEAIAPPDLLWPDPKPPPVKVDDEVSIELPYYEIQRRYTPRTANLILDADPDVGFVSSAAMRPSDATLAAIMHADWGDGYRDVATLDFCPGATLTNPVGKMDTVWDIEDEVDLEEVTIGSWALIEDEIVVVEAFGSGTVTVARGALDTVPAPHNALSKVFFCGDYLEASAHEHVDADVINVKLQPYTGSGKLDLGDADIMSVTMNSRGARPYPPGRFRFDGSYFPETILLSDLEVTWAGRNRKTQLSSVLLDFTDLGITPEVGTTYTMRCRSEEDLDPDYEVTGISDHSYRLTGIEQGNHFPTLMGVSDAYYSSVVLLLHFDGVDGGSTFMDRSQYAHSVTQHGSAETSTDELLFNRGSNQAVLWLDGNGDFLAISSTSEFDFGSSDFTVEAFVYLANTSNAYPTIFANDNFGTFDSNSASFFVESSTRQLVMKTNTEIVRSSVALQVQRWYHVALTRQSNTWRIFVNGVVVGSDTASGTLDFSSNKTLIGADGWTGTDSNWIGYMDEFRVTKGVARYTASFPAPTQQFYDPVKVLADNRPLGKFTIQVEAVRDGLTSWQYQEHTVEREGYGYNYGMRYGK